MACKAKNNSKGLRVIFNITTNIQNLCNLIGQKEYNIGLHIVLFVKNLTAFKFCGRKNINSLIKYQLLSKNYFYMIN